jgi:hypothetical protein
MNHNSDQTHVDKPGWLPIQESDERSYYVAVPEQLLDEQSSLIDLVISFAFDTLGARHLDVRICASES